MQELLCPGGGGSLRRICTRTLCGVAGTRAGDFSRSAMHSSSEDAQGATRQTPSRLHVEPLVKDDETLAMPLSLSLSCSCSWHDTTSSSHDSSRMVSG